MWVILCLFCHTSLFFLQNQYMCFEPNKCLILLLNYILRKISSIKTAWQESYFRNYYFLNCSYCFVLIQKMAEDAAVKASVKNCQAGNGNNISSHSPSISCLQNIKEQIPKYQVMLFYYFYVSVLLKKP